MIRHATLDDRAVIIELAETFLTEVGYDHMTVAATNIVDRCLSAAETQADETPHGVLLVIDNAGAVDGFFGFIIGDHPITGESVAFELGWYVRRTSRRGTQGIRLLLDAREAATALGADILQVSVLDYRLGRFLESYAFEKRESTYTLRLVRDGSDESDIS